MVSFILVIRWQNANTRKNPHPSQNQNQRIQNEGDTFTQWHSVNLHNCLNNDRTKK
jgi:hypothetical protein